MRQIDVSNAEGPVLDWLVAKCEGVKLVLAPFKGAKNFVILGQNMKPTSSEYTPTKSWAQGGPIIEREELFSLRKPGSEWECDYWNDSTFDFDTSYGPTPLIAAMRCYVTSKLGNVVEVPEELT